MLDTRGRLLNAALGFAGLPRFSYDHSLWALRSWLDLWTDRTSRSGWWRATFYTSGMEHLPTGAIGTSWKTFVEKRRNSITIGAATHERSA